MPAKQQTTVALSKEARAMVDKALIRRGESMAGYFSNRAGGRFVDQAVVEGARGITSQVMLEGPRPKGQENVVGSPAPGSGDTYLAAFMKSAGAAAEGQAGYDMRIAMDLFSTPKERSSLIQQMVSSDIAKQQSRIDAVRTRTLQELEGSTKRVMASSDRRRTRAIVRRSREFPGTPERGTAKLVGSGNLGLWFE